MDALRVNKTFGAILAVCLVILGLRELSGIVFGGGHHDKPNYGSLNEWAQAEFKGYRIDISEIVSGPDVVEAIYDLGALLLAVDIERGERSFRNNCASCHTIAQGGANGQGPNLYNTLGSAKQSQAGFRYSGALANTEGNWSWEAMDAWLTNPGKYARGTSMSFAGLKRDTDRANVLAYLASYSPDAPSRPEPLPEPEMEDENLTQEPDDAETSSDKSVATMVEGEIMPETVSGEPAPVESAPMESEPVADDEMETVTPDSVSSGA